MRRMDSIVVYADGSVNEEKQTSGAGFVIKTITGNVISKGGETLETTDSMMAEAKALDLAVNKAKEVVDGGIGMLYLKGDCNGVIEAVNPSSNQTLSNKHQLNIIERIQERLRDIDDIVFSPVPSELNGMADSIARRKAGMPPR